MKGQLHMPPVRGKSLKASEKILLDITDLMKEKHGPNMLTNILPHFKRSDIVYCFDENGTSVTDKLADCFPPLFSGEIVSKKFLFSQKPEFAEKPDKFKLVAVILGYSNFFLVDSNEEVGELRMKIQQLEMIGYETLVIKWDDWIKAGYEGRMKLIDDVIQRVFKN
jgi:hypothetical protein